MLEKQRHLLMLDMLIENQFVTVKEFCCALNASEATIRRDIIKLNNENKLKKIHGGAELKTNGRKFIEPLTGSIFYANRERQSESKIKIAQKAVELCNDNESITINGGSSTFMMGEYLKDRRMSVLTNSFELAHFLVENSENQVSLPGGEIYRKQSLVLSSFERDIIEYYHTSKMFLGTPGIGEFGVMESDLLLIRQEQKLMQLTDQLVILADSTKLGNQSNFVLCPLDKVDILITDSKADKKHLQLFEDNDIEVIIVEVTKES